MRVQGEAAAVRRRLPCAARRSPAWRSAARRLALWLAAGAPALLLGACSSLPSSINPVSWWHSLQGGAIAEQRPPPPGAADPYPNLASVPPAPPQPDRAALNQITDALIADRNNAQHEAAAAPLADPSSPTASPQLFGAGSTPPPGPPPPPGAAAKTAASQPGASPPAGPQPAGPQPAGPQPAGNQPVGPAAAGAPAAAAPPGPVASATMPAAPAPPAPAAPPAKAPVAAVSSVPLMPPGDTPAETAALPAIPAAPPAAPTVAGFAVPTPAPTPPPAPAAPATIAGNAVTVPFPAGSALLPSSATGPLRQLAAKRGSASIAVVGYGEADGASPDAQSTALTLGLARAQAMAAVLTSSGVPANAVQIDAQAIGHGGSARLVQ